MNAPGTSRSHGSSNGTDRSRAVCREPVRAPKISSRSISKEKKKCKPAVKKRNQKKSGRYEPYPEQQKPCPSLNYTPTSYVYNNEDPAWRPASPTWPGKDNA
ncbi:hypothetical protein CAEBREN_00882 [Caenorhabditis brenneri]|uniref:Uncharacterized protein n=1 Tax=Caenorhabditis brenneri TaxID=135651 RepID=G0NNL5_CAEBE|nr:hypothetical protein CAEBREN_00882 [Caenorhabditis brenneri]